MRGDVLDAIAAGRQMGGLSLGNALALCVVLAERDPARFRRAPDGTCPGAAGAPRARRCPPSSHGAERLRGRDLRLTITPVRPDATENEPS
jgi:hypothetical protein